VASWSVVRFHESCPRGLLCVHKSCPRGLLCAFMNRGLVVCCVRFHEPWSRGLLCVHEPCPHGLLCVFMNRGLRGLLHTVAMFLTLLIRHMWCITCFTCARYLNSCARDLLCTQNVFVSSHSVHLLAFCSRVRESKTESITC